MISLHTRRRRIISMITRAMGLVFIALACVFIAGSSVVHGDPGVVGRAAWTPATPTPGGSATLHPPLRGAPRAGRVTFTKTRVHSSGRDVAGFSAQLTVRESPAAPTPPAGLEPVEAEAWLRMAERQGSVAMPPFTSFYPARYGEPFIVEGDGVRVAVTPLGGAPVAAAVGSGEVVYRGAYPETDSRHVVSEGRSEEFLQLRSPAAPRRFDYELSEVSAGTRIELRDGAVHFTNQAGGGVQIEAPWVQEPNGQKRTDVVRWELPETGEGEKSRLSLILAESGLHYPLVVDPSWTATGMLSATRQLHTATLLPDGRVLVAGGSTFTPPTTNTIVATAELYDPVAGTWSATGSMSISRSLHTATLLPNGKVLVAGGANVVGGIVTVHASAELYDPATGSWSPTGIMTVARRQFAAALLANGKVLVASGSTAAAPTVVAELYDPATGLWSPTGSLATGRFNHTATLLLNGKVLVVGGSNVASTELYDPVAGVWSAAGSLAGPRGLHTAMLLLNGKVLVAGGDDNVGYLASAQVYDPVAGTWGATGSLLAAREFHAAVRLTGGRVLVAGGQNSSGILASAEVYNPTAGTWSATSSLLGSRNAHTGTLLGTGKVLVAGGSGRASAELYTDDTNNAPTANAGPDQFVEATSPSGAQVLLDGSGIDDPEGTPLTYAWTEGATPLGTTAQLTLPSVAFGVHTFTLTVNDGTTPASVTVTVRDTLAPTIAIASPTITTYAVNQAVAASFTCTDIPSGVASCVGTVANGSNIDTSSLGSHDFTVTAKDLSTSGTPGGNTGSITLSYSVLPVATIEATDFSASEQGLDPGTFTVSRTGPTSSALVVNYSVGGGATNGTDYQTLSGSVQIPAGMSSAVITVTPIDDGVVEPPKTVVVTVAANGAYIVGSPGTATVTILITAF